MLFGCVHHSDLPSIGCSWAIWSTTRMMPDKTMATMTMTGHAFATVQSLVLWTHSVVSLVILIFVSWCLNKELRYLVSPSPMAVANEACLLHSDFRTWLTYRVSHRVGYLDTIILSQYNIHIHIRHMLTSFPPVHSAAVGRAIMTMTGHLPPYNH